MNLQKPLILTYKYIMQMYLIVNGLHLNLS